MNQWYPEKLAVSSQGTTATYDFMRSHFGSKQHFVYAEFGVYQGDTALNVCRLFENAEVHLFDYADALAKAQSKLSAFPNRVFCYENSQRYNDSYNWALMRLIENSNNRPLFDYCFLDGAHTIAIDALTFFLCDRLLRVGGFMDFDDYGWRLRGSSLDPAKVPQIAEQYTDEQIDAFQVKMLVDLLVKPDPRYVEVAPNKVYQKVA
jgi:hypothetical protein